MPIAINDPYSVQRSCPHMHSGNLCRAGQSNLKGLGQLTIQQDVPNSPPRDSTTWPCPDND
jgi:hypothetical protein